MSTPCLGVATRACDVSAWLGETDDAWSFFLRDARHAMAKAHGGAKGDVRNMFDEHVPAPERGGAIGFRLDMRAGTLEAFVNGASVGVLFEGLPTRDPDVELYAAFGFESTLEAEGVYRYIPGEIDAPSRREHVEMVRKFKHGRGFANKLFKLVTEDGRHHRKMSEKRKPFGMVEVHYDAKGGLADAVWCETLMARWTQSISEVNVIVIHKPAGVRAADLDVEMRARYVRVRNRATRDVYLEGELEGEIRPRDSLWTVDPETGRMDVLLAKQMQRFHRADYDHGANMWARLFACDDELSDGDMDHDYTDLQHEYRSRHRAAGVQASEAGKADIGLRDDVEASGEDWWWQFNDDKTDMLPSYAVNNPLEGKGPNHRAV